MRADRQDRGRNLCRLEGRYLSEPDARVRQFHAGKVPDGGRIPLRQCPGKAGTRQKSAELYPEDYTVNVEALERVQPKDLTASEIAVRLGATWLPTEIVEQFMFEFLGTPRYAQWNIKVHFSAYTGEWNIEGKSYDRSNVKAYSTYGTGRHQRLQNHRGNTEPEGCPHLRLCRGRRRQKESHSEQEGNGNRTGKAGTNQAGFSGLDMGRP